MFIDYLRCINYDDFSIKLSAIEKVLEIETPVSNTLNRILEFIDINQDIFIHVKKTAICFDSLGAKARHLPGNKPLIDKLSSYVNVLIPSEPEETKNFLQLIRSTIFDSSQRLQAIADWVDLMRIPLVDIELTEEELIGLLTRLEYPDLTNYNFESMNLETFTRNLLKPNLKFKTKDSIFLSTLAKLCAQQEEVSTAEYVRNFAIEDEEARIEIAKLCALQNGAATASNIEDFAIEDETTRIEIAKLCAQENGGGTAYYIQNFAITDEFARGEIAKLCAQQDGFGTACSFDNFSISDETVRIEIGKLCAKQEGKGTAAYIQRFAIADEDARIEIAKICAQQNAEDAAEYIHNFKLENPLSIYQLFIEFLKANPKSLFHIQKLYPLSKELIKISQMMHVFKDEGPEESRRKELFEEIHVLIGTLPISQDNQKTILDMSCKIQTWSPRLKNATGLWLVSSILLMREMKTEEIEWLLETGVWSELGLLKDPALRVSLSPGLHTLSTNKERTKLWNGFLASVRGTKGQRGLMLLSIPFFNLQLIEEDKLLAVANHLSALQKKNDSSLRNVYQVKNFLHTMHSLASSYVLTPNQKQRGFEKIFFDQSSSTKALIDDESQILKNIIAAKGLLQLKDSQWTDSTENLNTLFRFSLEKLIPLEEFNGDVSSKYEEIFGTCRNPTGLLTYAAGLKNLKEPALLSCLGQYVVWVMDKTFKNKRYEITRNLHLAKVLEGNPGLLLKWKEEIQLDVHIMGAEDKKEVFNSAQWLRTKLFEDKHLGSQELPYLIASLNARTLPEQNIIFSSLIKEIKRSMKEEENKKLRKELELGKKTIKEILKRPIANEDEAMRLRQDKKEMEESLAKLKRKLDALSASTLTNPVLINLNLQKACLKLAKEGILADKTTLLQHLEEIDKVLHQDKELKTSEFARDVKGLIEGLRKQTEHHGENKKHLQVIFTDDPIDLLLSGTDINGSCQRLDGDPKLNKGLLGYLIDGKNRLLAIKDGDKIVARCMLRLLWNGNQPVVYRDRFYPDQISEEHKQALNALAKQVSQKLEVPLTSGDGAVSYNKKLQALGGPAPYEYCDAEGARGVQKEGRYTIQATLLE